MTASRSLLFLLAAAVCFAVALLVSLAVIQSNYDAWLAGGLLSYVISCLP